MRQLSIAIFGNTNNYPLLLADGLMSLGHTVRLIINRKELLHRPEARHPEWKTSYPEWIFDYSDITEKDVADETPALDDLLLQLKHGVDLVILNDIGPSLAGYLQSPYVVALTGSDLSFYANFDSLPIRTASWAPQYKRSSEGRELLFRLTESIARQRDGIMGAEVVCYGHRGLVPEGDRLLDDIGVLDTQRMMLHLSNVNELSARPLPSDAKLKILCGSRIVYRPENNPGLGAIDFKGTDVLIRGFAKYCQKGGQGELRLPQKGQDLDAARILIDDLDIASRVAWLPEMSLAEFYEEMAKADLICDQFGTSFPGMVTTDAYALGRPVMANLRNELFDTSSKALPGFDVKTVEEISNCLLLIENDRGLLKKMGLESRAYAEAYLSPEIVAQRLLEKCDLDKMTTNNSHSQNIRRSVIRVQPPIGQLQDTVAPGLPKNSSINQLLSSVESSVNEYRTQRTMLDLIDMLLRQSEEPGFWQKIRFRISLLLKHAALITKLHFISHDVCHRFEELSTYTLIQLKLTMKLSDESAEQTDLPADAKSTKKLRNDSRV